MNIHTFFIATVPLFSCLTKRVSTNLEGHYVYVTSDPVVFLLCGGYWNCSWAFGLTVVWPLVLAKTLLFVFVAFNLYLWFIPKVVWWCHSFKETTSPRLTVSAAPIQFECV